MSARRRPAPASPSRSWLMPAIVTGAIVVVVAGVVWAALLGHLF